MSAGVGISVPTVGKFANGAKNPKLFTLFILRDMDS